MTDLTAAGASLWSTGQSAVADGQTVARIRGEVTLGLESVASAMDGYQSYAVGIGIVTASAFAVGVTAVPSPLTEIEWEGWMWIHSGAALFRQSAAETESSPSSFVRIPIDTKAMRKIHSDEILIGVTELGTEVGSASLEYSARTRVLLLLP